MMVFCTSINVHFTQYMCCLCIPRENDDTVHVVRGGGGGQRVMIGIIIEVNDDNCGRPLTFQSINMKANRNS